MKNRKFFRPTEEEALNYTRDNFSGNGKIEVIYKTPINDLKDISVAYTPGVSYPVEQIVKNPDAVHEYTCKDNMIAVISDGTAVLGLGDIGPKAALPVMEGKAMMFKMLAGVDAFPICLGTKDPDRIIEIIMGIETVFGGFNLEDIAAPNCFYILDRLEKYLDIPVFHDDQQGTATVVLGALKNALKVVAKNLSHVKIVINGAGASGLCTARLLLSAGAQNIILCDKEGIIYEGRIKNMNPYKEDIVKRTNKEGLRGGLGDAMRGADVFIGLSVARQVTGNMVTSMEKDSIVFAMANPVPEIMPEEAWEAGARIVATGRYDYPNQVNNVVGFPGIMRGALDVRARDIKEEMLLSAANAIASLIPERELHENYIVPTPFHPDLYPRVAAAVGVAAIEKGIARIQRSSEEIEKRTRFMTRIIRKRFEAFQGILKDEDTLHRA